MGLLRKGWAMGWKEAWPREELHTDSEMPEEVLEGLGLVAAQLEVVHTFQLLVAFHKRHHHKDPKVVVEQHP